MDKIPEVSSSEEDSIKEFDKKYLLKETVASFSFESIYQNINIFTKLQYSKNEYFQQKTLNFLANLVNNNDKLSKNESESISSSESQSSSSSFSNFFFDYNLKKANKEDSKLLKNLNSNSSFSNSLLNNQKYEDLLYDNSKKSDEKSNHNLLLVENQNKKCHASQSVQPRNINNNNKYLNIIKKDDKLPSKKDVSNNDRSSLNFVISNSSGKQKNKPDNQTMKIIIHKTNDFKSKKGKNKSSLFSEKQINNIKTQKNFFAPEKFYSNLISSNIKSNKSENVFFGEKEGIKGSKRGSLKESKKGSVKESKKGSFKESIKGSIRASLKGSHRGSFIRGKLTNKYTKKKSKYKVGKSLTIKSNKNNTYKFKSGQKLAKPEQKKDEEERIKDTGAYFAKEEKEDCLII